MNFIYFNLANIFILNFAFAGSHFPPGHNLRRDTAKSHHSTPNKSDSPSKQLSDEEKLSRF